MPALSASHERQTQAGKTRRTRTQHAAPLVDPFCSSWAAPAIRPATSAHATPENQSNNIQQLPVVPIHLPPGGSTATPSLWNTRYVRTRGQRWDQINYSNTQKGSLLDSYAKYSSSVGGSMSK